MHTAMSERMEQLWADPKIAKKMLAGSAKGAEACRNLDLPTRLERSFRVKRAATLKRLQSGSVRNKDQ